MQGVCLMSRVWSLEAECEWRSDVMGGERVEREMREVVVEWRC